MLDGLDQVMWGRLQHAYGSAADVPQLIRALASPLPDERQAAFSELYGNIWHQGTIYEATQYAVPFLIELAASDETPDRHHILSFLGTLAEGTSYIDVHKNVVTFSPEDLSQQLKIELGWVAETRKAVKCGEALYLDRLRANEHSVSCAAGYVLSRFPEEGERYWQPLRVRFDDAESDELVRCGIAVLTNEFSDKGTSDTEWLLRKFTQEDRHSVRVALAVSIVLCDEQRAGDALEFLATNLLSDEQIDQDYQAQPWDIGEPVWHIVRAMSASKRSQRMLVARFNELLSQGASRERLKYLRYVILGEPALESVHGNPDGPLVSLTIPND